MATTTNQIVLSLSLYKVTFMSSSFLLLLLHLQTHLVLGDANGLKTCGFDRIYQFGDSMSDTGNLVRESAVGANTSFARLPYGQTFFHNATGRCSDGRLLIDFFAMAAGLPFLDPYLNTDGDFRHGANFAVASSTALPVEVLANKSILTMYTNSSLSVQLNWMSTHFYSIFHAEEDYGDKLKNSLFMLGETGGNDYNYAFVQGKTNEEVKSVVPEVVQATMNAVRDLIACCGIGGDYKFSLIDGCGDPEVKVCPNLNQHISWDGVHLTQQII